MTAGPASYVGRFAPSLTGPLHFGSLLAAIASYAQAKTNDGQWSCVSKISIRRENNPGNKLIIEALEAHGFEWDGPVTYQSSFTAEHELLIQTLINWACLSLFLFTLGTLQKCRAGRAIYPGTCRRGCLSNDVAIRLRTNDDPIEFRDALQGRHPSNCSPSQGISLSSAGMDSLPIILWSMPRTISVMP